MSYEPTQWSAGDTVTSAKLNKMEQGIASGASGPLLVTLQEDGIVRTFDKTWKEVNDAFMAGRPVIVNLDNGYGKTLHGYVVNTASEDNNSYDVHFYTYGYIEQYNCGQENGYPFYSYD